MESGRTARLEASSFRSAAVDTRLRDGQIDQQRHVGAIESLVEVDTWLGSNNYSHY